MSFIVPEETKMDVTPLDPAVFRLAIRQIENGVYPCSVVAIAECCFEMVHTPAPGKDYHSLLYLEFLWELFGENKVTQLDDDVTQWVIALTWCALELEDKP